MLFLLAFPSEVIASNLNVFAYASTNVTTGAYVVLWKSLPNSVSNIQVCDTSGHLLKIATGASGSESDIISTTVSGCVSLPIYLPAGTQLSIRAIDASATTGFNVVSIQ